MPVIAHAAGVANAQATTENLTFRSATYSSFRQLLKREEPSARMEVHATLSLPAASSGRVPAVVLIHTLAGYRDQNEGWQASALREVGFATLTYDSFAARGMGDLVITPLRGPPPYASALADAFAALSALARDPRIDLQHIAILGFSFGGEVAHDAAFERLRATLAGGELRFAAHVAYYPAGVYGVVAASNAHTGAPVLMMVGGDDTLPVAKAEAYLAYARGSGYPAPVELLSYADAKHGWTDPGLGAAREYPYLASTRDCPFALITPNRGLELLVDGQERPFHDGSWEACIRRSLGYVMGYDEKIRRQSTDAAIAFLKQNLSP
jgi:dienelactone hydrolase